MSEAASADTSYVTKEFCPHVWAVLQLVTATFTPDDERVPLETPWMVPVGASELETVDGELAVWPLCDILIFAGVAPDPDGLFDELLDTPAGRVLYDVLGPVGP